MREKHFLIVLTKEFGLLSSFIKTVSYLLARLFNKITPYKFKVYFPSQLVLVRSQVNEVPNFNVFLNTNQTMLQELNSSTDTSFLGLKIADLLSFNFVAGHAEELPYFLEAFKIVLDTNPIHRVIILDFIPNYKTVLLKRLCLQKKLRFHFLLGFLHPFTSVFYSFFESLILKRQDVNTLSVILNEKEKSIPLSSSDQKNWMICLKKRSKDVLMPLIDSVPSFCISGKKLDDQTLFLPTILSKKEIEECLLHSRKILTAFEKILDQSSTHHDTTEGVIYGDLQIQTVKKILKRELFEITLNIKAAFQLFDRSTPLSVISLDPTPISGIFFELSKKKKIKSFLYACIDDGYSVTRALWAKHLLADQVFTLNQNQHDFFEKILPKPTQLTLVGSLTKTEGAALKNKLIEKQAFSLAYTLDTKKPWILFGSRHVSEVLPSHKKQKLYEAAFYVREKLNAEIIFKCHPHERLEESQKLAKKIGLKATFISSKNDFNANLYKSNDCMVNIYESSVTLEALQQSLPVIIFGKEAPSKNSAIKNTSYENFDAVLFSNNKEALLVAIQKVLEDKDIRQNLIQNGTRMIEYFFGPQDGKALTRMKEFILGLP